MGKFVFRCALALALVACASTFVWLRINLAGPVTNIDEYIPVSVSQAMQQNRNLDPNWAHAEMREWPAFRYPQYSFYTYNVSSHWVLQSSRGIRLGEIQRLRLVNLLYGAITIAAVATAALWLGLTPAAIAFAVIALVVSPTLSHDAQMARPECFLYMLFSWYFFL